MPRLFALYDYFRDGTLDGGSVSVGGTFEETSPRVCCTRIRTEPSRREDDLVARGLYSGGGCRDGRDRLRRPRSALARPGRDRAGGRRADRQRGGAAENRLHRRAQPGRPVRDRGRLVVRAHDRRRHRLRARRLRPAHQHARARPLRGRRARLPRRRAARRARPLRQAGRRRLPRRRRPGGRRPFKR